MHHGDGTDDFRDMFGHPSGLGATGQFPRGKLNKDDEGEIKVAIAAHHKRGVVVIDFGKPTAWIGFSPEQAVEIAEMLNAKAWELRGVVPPLPLGDPSKGT